MKLLSRLFGSSQAFHLRLASLPPVEAMGPRELYKLLDAYYYSNGLYDALAEALYNESIWKEALKPLRNPARRVVEFYPATIWPGSLEQALPIVADNADIIEPIEQVWKWSGWGAAKQLVVRDLAKYGDMFVKVVRVEDQVYFQRIDPNHVIAVDHDVRGFVTYVRVDIPQRRRSGDEVKLVTHTEIWDKALMSYRAWEHEQGIGAKLDEMGTPAVDVDLAEFGIDFVPFVHGKFVDVGEPRGVGAFTLAIDKIDECNRKATRLAQMIFRYNKALWALRANSMDATGRPMPPPRVAGGSGSGTEGDTIELGDDRLLRLPGMSTLESMVPQVNYEAHLNALAADLNELAQELPELIYYQLQEKTGDPSGRALQLLLSAAIAKALEARGNAETALARADEMALSMGQAAGMWRDIGNFEAGDFTHSFAERDVLPLSEIEQAEESKVYVDMGVPLKTALRRQGWSDADLEDLETDLEEERGRQQETLAAAVLNAQRAMDNGTASNGMEGMPPSPNPSPISGSGGSLDTGAV